MKHYLAIFSLLLISPAVLAAEYSSQAYIQEGLKYEKRGNYFQAARYYFQAEQKATNQEQRALADSYISNALVAQGMPQSASYFFLKAVSSGSDQVIRNALRSTRALVDAVGGIIFKKYMLKYTREAQYPADQRDYFLYFLAEENLHNLKANDAIRAVNDISPNFPNYPSALFIRGTASLFINNTDQGVSDFKACANLADSQKYKRNQTKNEIKELKNRCYAGAARSLYQAKRYEEADTWYDQVEISTMVWPQIQYERAWSSIARGDYNRALGRLVTYKAPGLAWFHDSEVEMLRTISYLQMCLYEDTEKESAAFMGKYGKVGQDMKVWLDESRDGSTRSLVRLFERGIQAMNSKIQSENAMNQVLNRFVRSPYFVQIAKTGDKVRQEMNYLAGLGDSGKRGLGGFLRDVLVWRWQTAQEVGGMFVRERLATEYKNLLANVSTVDIVKLEMLRRARGRAEQTASVNEGVDTFGNVKRGSLGRPNAKNNQYSWDFNGEFWADELGDYVFALRPECN